MNGWHLYDPTGSQKGYKTLLRNSCISLVWFDIMRRLTSSFPRPNIWISLLQNIEHYIRLVQTKNLAVVPKEQMVPTMENVQASFFCCGGKVSIFLLIRLVNSCLRSEFFWFCFSPASENTFFKPKKRD